MNTNSNTYTVIYSIILVVVVAAVLAFAAKFLQPTQEKNVKEDTISQILTAADLYKKGEKINILQAYTDNLDSAIVVNGNGIQIRKLDSLEVYTTSMLKEQIEAADSSKTLPVYIFKNGVTVVPCYGAGLWGPIWGYIGVDDSLTVVKACFGHKGETPGLGAKITDEPENFSNLFTGKKITEEIKVGKGVNPERKADINAVDAISGATITSNATGVMVNKWLGFYQNYFTKAEEKQNKEE